MKLTAYLRVSTAGQVKDGLGLEVQRKEIRAWAKANDHKIVSWHADEGISGSEGLDTRHGLGDALDDLSTGKAQGLVFYRLDRLARDVLLQETLLRDIAHGGGKVFSTFGSEQENIADDPTDPDRKMIRTILGAVATRERELITLRLASGRRRKADKGGYACGRPAFGFKAEGRELVPVAAEQAAVRRIGELRAGGASVRVIAEQLTAEGFTPKRGGQWHPETVRRVLARSQS